MIDTIKTFVLHCDFFVKGVTELVSDEALYTQAKKLSNPRSKKYKSFHIFVN